MSQTIDNLEIEIQAQSTKAESGLDALCRSLEKLKGATKGGAGLTSVSNRVKKLNESLSGLNGGKVGTLREMTKALEGLSAVGKVKLSSTIPTTIEKIGNALQKINVGDLGRITQLVDALKHLSAIQGMTLSSSLANQIVKIGEAAKAMQPEDLSKFGNLAEALVPLRDLRDISLRGITDGLRRLPEIATAINGMDVSRFEENLRRIAQAIGPLATHMESLRGNARGFSSEIESLSRSTQSLSATNDNASRSYVDLYSRLVMAYHFVTQVGRTIAGWIGKANEYIENMNLFNVSMGEYAGQAQRYAEKVGEVMGIDPGDWMRDQGIFMTMATGFGVAGDRAAVMSQQLTQLGYDLSSFFNISVEDAIQKLQSGLSGELEPLRRLGYDLSQARLEAVALSLGIKKSVNSMTQAEKAQLRYHAILSQVTTAQGDMARTLEDPANQLRVLKAQISQAARALGNIFIPMLSAVLPYLIALARAVRTLAQALASLLGGGGSPFTTKSMGGIADMSGGIGTLADEMDNATDKAKGLKNFMMGFDELNVIDPTGGGGGGGGDGLGDLLGDDWAWDLLTYDFLGDLVATQADNLYNKFKPVLDWFVENLDVIMAVVKAIGIELLAWKIAKSLMPDFKLIQGDLSKLLSLVSAVATTVLTIILVYEFDNKFIETGKWGYLVADGIATALGAFISGRVIAHAYSGQAGYYTAGAVVAISAATTLVAVFKGVEQDGINWKTITSSIWAILKGAVAGGLIAVAIGASVVSGVVVGALLTLGAALLVNLVAAKLNKEKANLPELWGDIQLTATAIQQVAETLLNVDVTARVEVIDAQLENEDAAKEKLNTLREKFNVGLNKILIGAKIDEGEVESLISQLTGEGGIIDSLQSALDAQKATIELAVGFVPPKTSGGQDISAQLLDAIGVSNEVLNKVGADIGSKLSQTMQEGVLTGFMNGEKHVIAELGNWLNRITAAVNQGKISGEFAANIELLLSDLTRESFQGVLDGYDQLMSELTESYTMLEKQAYADAVAYKEGLEQAKAYYDSIGDAVSAAKVQEALDQVNEQIENWDIAASVASAVDSAKEEARPKVIAAIKDIFSPAMSDVGDMIKGDNIFNLWIKTWAENIDLGIFEDMGGLESLGQGFANHLQTVMQKSLSAEDFKVWMDAKETIGISEWDVFSTDVQSQLFNSLVEAFGAEQTRNLMEHLGYDLTGVMAQGILNGTTQITDAGENAITLLGGALDGKVVELTPELVETFKSLGVDLSMYLEEGITEGTEGAVAAAGELGKSVTDTATAAFTESAPEIAATAGESGADAGAAYVNECATALENGAQTVSDGAKTAAAGVNQVIEDTVTNAGEQMTDAVDSATQNVKSNVETTTTESIEAFDTMSESIDSAVAATTTAAGENFTGLANTIIAQMSGAYTTVTAQWSQLSNWFSTNVKSPVTTHVTLLCATIKTQFLTAKTTVTMAWNTVPGWFRSSVTTPIESSFEGLKFSITTDMGSAASEVRSSWSGVAAWFGTGVTDAIGGKFSALASSIEGSMVSARDGTKSAWDNLPGWFKNNVIDPMISKIRNAGWYDAGRDAANKFKKGLQSVDMPSLAPKSMNGSYSLNTFVSDVEFYERGGYVENGQMFVAREAGPEMVGQIHNKTAVANNDQIVEAVSTGVYNAVTMALGDNDRPIEVTVKLDGETVYQNQQRVAEKKGYRFTR